MEPHPPKSQTKTLHSGVRRTRLADPKAYWFNKRLPASLTSISHADPVMASSPVH